MAGRPLGVTIIAILQLLGALVGLLGFALSLVVLMLLPLFGLIFAVITGVIALVGFILFYGLWTLKGWAWILTLLFNIFDILLYILQGTYMSISMIISVIIVLYLLVPSTRAAFKK